MSTRRAELDAMPGEIQLGLIGTLLGLAALAWAIAGRQMAGMDEGPGTNPGPLGFFVGAWVVMMAAMMLPSIVPMVVTHARMLDRRREGHAAAAAAATTIFVAGYLVAWVAAGLLGYALFELGRAATGDLFSWGGAGPYLAAGILLGAAVYQLTRAKDICLCHCRSPRSFLSLHRKPGRAGDLRLGIVHGGWCVGCCWALMASLFALGVMSLAWMAFIAALIAVERLLPWKEAVIRGTAVLLLGLGLMVALAPGSVPVLTVPGSSPAMSAMEGSPGMRSDSSSAMP